MAGGERNTTPRQRKGVIEHEESGKRKVRPKERGAEKRELDEGSFDPFRSGSVVTVGEEQNVGHESTVRRRCNRRGYNLKLPAFLCCATDHAKRLI